ncbi:MAG: hypothetical protein FWC46_07670 [Actinomycetia bacterium]|nr:hypothetical protein [Actinomycetes bacterium]
MMKQTGMGRSARSWLVAVAIGIVVVGLVVTVIATSSRLAWQQTPCHWWAPVEGQPSTVTVGVEANAGVDGSVYGQVRVLQSETSTAAQLTCQVSVRRGSGPWIGVAGEMEVEVRLASPLNGRQVVDQNGDPIPEKPPS